jgi:hypothetical protein
VKYTNTINAKSRLLREYTGDESFTYDLTCVQRIFVLFEQPDSCHLASAISILTGMIILLNTFFFVIATCPSYQVTPSTCMRPVCNNDPFLCPGRMVCPPETNALFQHIQAACVIAFAAKFCLRILTCWSATPRLANLTTCSLATMPKYMLVARYLLKWDTMIDICAIVPFFVLLIQYNRIFVDENSGFVRVLWLPRLLTSLSGSKATKAVCEVFYKTLVMSTQTLFFTFLFITIGTVIFASIMFNLEGGYFRVTPDYPQGAYVREMSILGVDGDRSLFTSIPVSMYFTVVTTTSLGYGDIYPCTGGGLVIACLLCLLGVVVLALPIAVIGGNFANLHESYLTETSQKLLYRPAALLRRQEVEHLNASEVALHHNSKCRNLSSDIQILRNKASSQAEKIVKVNVLLSAIIERSRRLRLAKIMSQINMKHRSSLLHRSKQPASQEQAMKWQANPKLSRSGSTVNLGSNSSWSSEFSTSPPKLELLPIQSDTWRSFTKMCHVLNLDGPIMVPRIYTHRAEHDLYFPEVCLCVTFLFVKVILNVACITYYILNLADLKVQETRDNVIFVGTLKIVENK